MTKNEVEFIQDLFDRYTDSGGVIALLKDQQGFMNIVRKHAPVLAKKSELTEDMVLDCFASRGSETALEVVALLRQHGALAKPDKDPDREIARRINDERERYGWKIEDAIYIAIKRARGEGTLK